MGSDEELVDTARYTTGEPISIPVEYNSRDLILYALGIGSTDPRFVYEGHPEFGAFPTYPVVLTSKGDSYDTLPFPSPAMGSFPLPPLKGMKVGLDAEKTIEKVAELPKHGARLQLVGGVVGVHRKGRSGALIERQFELTDEFQNVYYRILDGIFLVGAKDFKESGKTFSKTLPAPVEVPTRVVETATGEHVASLYRLSGDYNALHVDPTNARQAGFEKPIMHGLCTLGHVTRALLDTLADGDSRRYKSVQVRFASPVVPGQTLVTEIWSESSTNFVFQTRVKESDKVCISNGRFELLPAEEAAVAQTMPSSRL